jgi:hypothetical protein
MCLYPGFVHATQGVFVQRQLLQCRTCGSQTFHVLDCCRNPDYVQVPSSHLGERLKAWLGGMQATVQAWLFQPHRRRERSASPEVLDAWEARRIVINNSGSRQVPRETTVDMALEAVEHETVSTPR